MDCRRIGNELIGLFIGASVLTSAYWLNAEEIKIDDRIKAKRIYEYVSKELNDPWVDATGSIKIFGSKIFLKDGLTYRVSAIETLDGTRHLNVEVEEGEKGLIGKFSDIDADGQADAYQGSNFSADVNSQIEERYSEALENIFEQIKFEDAQRKPAIRAPDNLCRGCVFTQLVLKDE